jgi:uncharacterized membrane protein YfcA
MDAITWSGWLILGLSALLIGISKTGIPGTGIMAIPLVAMVFSAKASTGLILPMLIVGDIFAVSYYHRHAVWRHLIRLFPFAVAGILIGYGLMRIVTDRQLRPIIGAVVLIMLALGAWRNRKGNDVPIPAGWWFPAGLGLLAGVTTMMANAAGPILVIYLLAMRLPKEAFIGTGAWYFFLLNCFKVPFSAHLGLITWTSLSFNLILAPVIVTGALLGVRLVRYLPEKTFTLVVQLLAAAGAIRLLF